MHNVLSHNFSPRVRLGIALLILANIPLFIVCHTSTLVSIEYKVSLGNVTVADQTVDANIAKSIRETYNSGAVLISFLIAIFSVSVPYIKLLTLLYLWLRPVNVVYRKRILSFFNSINKWAMIDIFVYTFIMSLFTYLHEIGPGIYIQIQPLFRTALMLFPFGVLAVSTLSLIIHRLNIEDERVRDSAVLHIPGVRSIYKIGYAIAMTVSTLLLWQGVQTCVINFQVKTIAGVVTNQYSMIQSFVNGLNVMDNAQAHFILNITALFVWVLPLASRMLKGFAVYTGHWEKIIRLVNCYMCLEVMICALFVCSKEIGYFLQDMTKDVCDNCMNISFETESGIWYLVSAYLIDLASDMVYSWFLKSERKAQDEFEQELRSELIGA
jgi:hypothetical protein